MSGQQSSLAVLNVSHPPVNLTQAWSLRTSETISALIAFGATIRRWQSAGRIDSAEFVIETQRLEAAGLAGWFDDLVGLALLATCNGEGGRI